MESGFEFFAFFQVLLPLFEFLIITEDALDNLGKKGRGTHTVSLRLSTLTPCAALSLQSAIAAQPAITPWSPT